MPIHVPASLPAIRFIIIIPEKEPEYQVYSNAYIEENHEQTEDSSNLFHHPVSIHTESFS
jgi:hypothetical protein